MHIYTAPPTHETELMVMVESPVFCQIISRRAPQRLQLVSLLFTPKTLMRLGCGEISPGGCFVVKKLSAQCSAARSLQVNLCKASTQQVFHHQQGNNTRAVRCPWPQVARGAIWQSMRRLCPSSLIGELIRSHRLLEQFIVGPDIARSGLLDCRVEEDVGCHMFSRQRRC